MDTAENSQIDFLALVDETKETRPPPKKKPKKRRHDPTQVLEEMHHDFQPKRSGIRAARDGIYYEEFLPVRSARIKFLREIGVIEPKMTKKRLQEKIDRSKK